MSGKQGFFAGLASGVAVCLAAALFLGFLAYTDMDGGLLPVRFGSASSNAPDAVSNKMGEIYGVLDRYYVDDYDKERTAESLYTGMVYGVGDPYTVYMDKSAFESFMEDTEGSFAGLGIVVSVAEEDNRIVVVTPFEGCPGARAGIMAKDKIIKVNGYAVNGDNMNEAVSMMKGEPGTAVTVTVYRENTRETLDFNIVREHIEVPSVTHKMLEGGVGYIRISQFTRVTDGQYNAALADLTAQGLNGLILDLRNNPGGLLDVVCHITDTLLPEGTIVYTEDKTGKREYTESDKNAIGVPLLVLVNGSSASASEVLSGAVKDTGVGELLGERTFGKGLVQNIYRLSDGSAVKVTIAKYYTPSGVCIQGEGIEPNYAVELDEQLAANLSAISPEEDAQLTRAMEIMAGKIGQ